MLCFLTSSPLYACLLHALQAPTLGLRTPFRGGTLQDQAKVAVGIARGGLQRRGLQEESFLERLEVIADTGLSQVRQCSGSF
jgi:glutamate--cysteine ligase